MDFFQRLGNFFTGKGWVNDDEKRRREQQVQPQPQQSQPQPVQQPQLNSQPRMNMPWANSSGGLNQSSQPKVNLNPLQQANQVNQQLNLNSQNNQAKPQLTVNDAPKMLTPEGQQDWVNKQNKQIQIQNANSQPIQQPRPQQVQQPQPQAPKPVPVQPQQPRPQTITSPNVINQQNDMRRMGIDPNPVHTAIQHANDELNQYRTAQSNRQDIIDNKMRARGVSEPEIAKSRQTRIQLENQARASADEARRSQNMANIVGAVTAPGRAVASATKGFIDGAGRTVGDTGDKMSLAIADAMYGITGDEKYNKTRQRIIQQGQQRNAQYDKQFGVFKKNDADVDVAHELGQSGQRLIQDMGTGVATAGVAPVVRAFAENAADFVTDANAHGKNTRDVLPAAYANAAAQAAIEKVGLDRVLSPGGKTVARRMIKSALAEGGEEAAQQLTENAFAKHTYDPDRKYSEGVVKSALMGAALGGPAGAGNFGGVRQTGNHPSATMSAQIAQSQQTQQQTPGKLGQEALVQRQVRQAQNQNTGYTSFYRRPADNRSLRQAAEVSAVNTQTSQAHPIQSINVNRTVETTMPNASPALKQAVSRNISDIQHGDTNAIATRQQTTGKLENYLIEQATQNVQNTVAQDVRYKLSPEQEVFFKDSKIRDENGNLKTVYHGTKSNFDEFSHRKIGNATDPGLYGAGFYFSDHEGTSRNYGDRLIKAHLNIKNPLNLGDFNSKESLAEHLRISPDILSDSGGFIHPTTSHTGNFSSALRYAGYDGVVIPHTTKGARGNEIVALDPEQIKYIDNLNPTDNPDMRYKANSTARTELEELQQSSELLARHLRLTGDERLVFNEWQNEMQRKALGYYNPKTDTINLNQLTEATLNHELGHKILERADNKQELLDTIRESYGDDYLISKYGKEYGDSDINLLAEEQLADGFSEYYNGKLHGEDAPRLAARLHIPQRIVAIYDRITEAIRGLIGKQDIIKQFYAQMETGKFRNTQQQTPGGDGRVRTMSIDPERALHAIKGIDDLANSRRALFTLARVSDNLANRIKTETGISISKDARIVMDRSGAVHMLSTHGQGGKKPANPLTDADLGRLPYVLEDPDVIIKGKPVRNTERIRMERNLEGNKIAIVEVIKKGNELRVVTYFNDSSSGRTNPAYNMSRLDDTSETGQLQSTNLDDSLANSTQNVNNANRYKLEDDGSFYDKTRPSVQDVWGTDSVSLGYSQNENGNWGVNVTPENTNEPNSITHTIQETSTDSKPPSVQRPLTQADRRSLHETVESQPLNQNQAQEFKNVPMEEGHLLTKGNLYEQTKPGIQDDWTKPFQDGDYEYRLHTKRSRDGKKSFNSFERRYVGDDGEYGDWMPTSRAAYIWKSQTKKIDKVNRDQTIQEALKAAKQDGEVQEFMAYENPGREGGIAVVPLVGEHSIDGGFVRNPKTGEIEGNYIQVTPFGVVHQTNGKFDVLEVDHLTSALDKSKGGITDNFNRLVEKNVKNELGQKLLKDLYYQKTEAYANYADAVENIIGKHKAIAKYVDKARPRFKNEKKFWEDVGMYTEGKFPVGAADESMQTAFAKKYGEQAAARVKEYDQFMRENYDSMIENLNEIRRMYGKDEVPYLKNYMPHIEKRSGMLGRAVDKLLAASPVGIKGDIESQARGEIPASLAGLSADFKPTHKFNANEKQRRGGMMDYEKDPRKAFEYYTDVMLYNTHMEPVIARGRQIESSMRAMDMARKNGTRIDPDSNLAQGEKISNKATIAVQDFVNEMAGKSSSLDRPFIDRTNAGVQVIRRLESVNGANKILGNLSSTLAQTLNLPETVRDNGLRNTGRAFLTAFQKGTKEAMHKSAFLRERYTDTEGKFIKSNYQKATNAISVVSGMNLVEKKFIQLNWAANYNRFKKQGLTGYQLIKAADQATERAVGGRGIGAMPQVYKSTLGKMFLQFSYETNESWKNNIAHAKKIGSDIKRLQFKDGASGAVRAAEAFVVAYGLNMLMKQITGNEPLANMADAIKDALSNDADDDGEDDKLGQKIARVTGEAAKANPFSQAAVNMIPKSEREKIFGKSSDFGRFDGATGVAQTASNLLGAGFYAVQGDKENTEKNLRGLMPAGNQIKKTTEGAQLLREGADTYTDKYGKTRTNFEVDNNDPWTQAKALLFGKNAVRPDEKANGGSGTFTLTTGGGEAGKAARDFERGLKKGEYKIQDGLLVNKKGDVQREYYKKLAESQGESDEAYSNWMKAYNIDGVSTIKKEFSSGNDILNKLENGEKKADKAKSAVDILMGKHKDLPDWAKERYYKESGYSKEQIEYGAMTTHKEVSLMDNYWRQKAQESSHEELMQALTNGRRKSIVGQMFAKNGIVNKLKAEGYITKQEAKALNAAEFDVDGNRITKEGSGGSGSGRGGSGRGRGRSGASTASPLISAAVKSINSLSSAAPRANKTSGSGRSIDQIGKNLISRMNTQKQVNTALKQWNGGNSSKKPRVRTTKARA